MDGELDDVGLGLFALSDGPPDPNAAEFEFRDTEDGVHVYRFSYRPLGIVLRKDTTPVQVLRHKFNSYAGWMGVQDGWTISKVAGLDVSAKSTAEVEELTADCMQDKATWPLRMDFRDPGQSKRRVFMVTTHPIGVEFDDQMVVSGTIANTFASSHGIQKGWQLIGLGHNTTGDEPLLDLTNSSLTLREVQKKFREAVTLLDGQ